jgi:hypothetical protein
MATVSRQAAGTLCRGCFQWKEGSSCISVVVVVVIVVIIVVFIIVIVIVVFIKYTLGCSADVAPSITAICAMQKLE